MTDAAGIATEPRPLVIWRFIDGKPGHENQTLGLSRALADLRPVDVHDVPVRKHWRGWLDLLLARCPLGAALPNPDLLIGAGHATHLPLLACRRVRGGRAVVLMKPGLPPAWFDLCLIPEHDGVAPSVRVLTTRGVLNPISPSARKDPGFGVILVGGPSRHYGWDAVTLMQQVAAIVANDSRHWTLATSRRTPADTLAALQGIEAENLQVVPSEQTASGWLAAQLEAASVAWVTEDSVSMLYEALTSGAACGVLPGVMRRAGRVRAGLQALLDAAVVRTFDDWQQGRPPQPPEQPFNEAARCARTIVEKWFAS